MISLLVAAADAQPPSRPPTLESKHEETGEEGLAHADAQVWEEAQITTHLEVRRRSIDASLVVSAAVDRLLRDER